MENIKQPGVSFDNNEYVPTNEIASGERVSISKNVDLSDNNRARVTVQFVVNDASGNAIQVIVENPRITGSYNLQVEKVGEDNNTKLEGVKFSAKDKNEESLGEEFTTNADGLVQIVDKTIEEATIDWYDITEVSVGSNKYVKLDEPVRVYVETVIAEDGNSYKVNRISFNPIEDTEDEQAKVKLERTIELPGENDPVDAQIELNGNTIKLKNESYPQKIRR